MFSDSEAAEELARLLFKEMEAALEEDSFLLGPLERAALEGRLNFLRFAEALVAAGVAVRRTP